MDQSTSERRCHLVVQLNCELRNSVREYVHRIGRTGRAGRQGFAITLLDEKEGDFRHCAEIVKVLEERLHGRKCIAVVSEVTSNSAKD